MDQIFENRKAAGRQLSEKLREYRNKPDLLVLGLPRGGVPVAFETASQLDAELDVLVVRKLGAPWNRELAMGAVAGGGTRVLNENVIRAVNVSNAQIDKVTQEEQAELERRETLYRGESHSLRTENRAVIIIDDGLATGATMSSAIQALRLQNPESITVAVPVAPPEVRDRLAVLADHVVCLQTPTGFSAVGSWYRDFAPTTDEAVRTLLQKARKPQKV